VAGAVVALAGLTMATPARAATVPTGFQEYHVIGQEQHVWDMFNRPVVGQGFAGYTLSNAMLSVVSVTASSASQIIYYDHWEDNVDTNGDGILDFEPDIVNVQAQAQTLVLGDGNPANGDACTYIAGPCAGDIIAIGDTLSLNSNVNTGTGAAPNCGGALNLQGCVPLNPRLNTDFRFDGGDRLVTSGGPVSLVHVQEPTANLPGILGGAVEITSRQAIGAATSYSVPVGEDSRFGLGDPGPGIPFGFVDLNLVAFEDNTSVQVQSPGVGTVNFTLNTGEHWSSQGQIDGGPITPAIALVINEGTKVSTDKPLAGMIFASADGNRFYATREFALLPDILHSTDYITTAPGDNPAGGNNPKQVYIYNPDPFNPITVTYTDSVGTGTFPVAPNTTVAYSSGAGAGRFPPNGSTVRLTSNRNFWGVTAYDSQGTAFDWGHSWLATAFLTDTYTIPFAPDNPAGPPGASPVFVSATTNNTCVQVDFDNDGFFDQVGNGTGGLLPFSGGTCATGYFLDAPGAAAVNPNALRIYDNNAADGTPNNDTTGARVVANKAIALGYGLDTDLAPPSGAGILDLGYWVYPVSQKFLDPVLVVDKSADVTTVPTAGGMVTYTIEVEAFAFGPLTTLQVLDLLPVGVPGASYVPGSTVITNPDLSQVTGPAADPAIVPVGGRDQLDWSAVLAANVDTLQTNETLTVQYTVNIPLGASGVLTNEAAAIASLGTSVFAPTDTADVMRTDVILNKTATDDGSPEAGENLTYTISVANGGAGNETNVVITDPLPVNTTFVPASITTAGPFAGVYDAGQNAVVWTAATLAAGVGPFALSFQAAINPTTPTGTVIENTADFESALTTNFASNTTSTTLGGPTLAIAKTALGNPNPVHPGEVVTFEITVENTGAGAANNLFIEDLFSVNGTYVPGSMQWRLNAAPFSPLTDAADADEGLALVDRVQFLLAQLGAGQDIAFRFQMTVNAGTSGANFGNQATVSSDEIAASDTNLVQMAIVGDAVVTGHLFVDLDGNGVQNAGEPNLANVDVLVTDEDGFMQTVSTDALGNYSATVPADNVLLTGQTILDIDQTDPDFPNGAVLTTGNDPQTVFAVSGGTVASAPVGHQPLPLTISKTSSAGGTVAPGDTITYTIDVQNFAGTIQTDVTITDPLPAGTTYVPGSTLVTTPSIRVTEYYLGVGNFGGNSFDLTLNRSLENDYFVIVQGSDGNGSGAGNRTPNMNYVALTADPFGSGDLAVSAGANVITLTRQANNNDWVGVVTVVESLANAGPDGFTLHDVQRVVHGGATTVGADTSGTAWTDINQVMLMGGFNGAGCDTGETQVADQKVCHARIYPTGANTINWTRDAGGATSLTTATSTVMVVEWGGDWTVQRTRVQGNNGGDGANAVGEYNTAALGVPVARDDTWVWGTGHTNDQGIGDAAEAVLLTLGDGVNQNAVEGSVAAGIEYAGNALDFEVYALTHPDLAVDYRFKVDGDAGALTFDQAVDAAVTGRMALAYNGQNGTGSAYPRPMFSARYVSDTSIRLERRRSGQDFPAWVQGIDFSAIDNTTPGGAPPALVPAAANFGLPPDTSMSVTFQVTVDDPLASGITQITNTATALSNESPATMDTTVDNVSRPQVNIEPNAAGTALASGAVQTIAFSHSVRNDGNRTDSFSLNAFSARGWTVELVDPATLAVIATDSNGDGVWDGATPNTGSLAAGESVNYLVRVTIPGGTGAGTVDTVELRAISDLRTTVRGSAFDEIAVADGSVPGAGDVLVIPDNTSNAIAGDSAVYTHTVTNRTGVTDIFDLSAVSSQGWTTTIYRDTNADGVYTAGVDTAIGNTASLATGASQTIFVVVDVPGAAVAGTVDITNFTALSRVDPNLGGVASDTTTVGANNSVTRFDFSGGGSQVVNAGDTPVYAGTLTNQGTAADTYEFTISASVYGPGGAVADGLNHASQLWVDTNADGVADTQIARDDDGDGTWDFVDPAFDSDTDGSPDVAVAAGAALAYEFRRPVDAAQTPYRDPVTLTVTSVASGAADSVTATTAILLVTRAVIGSFTAYGTSNGVVVQWQTTSEHGTVGFHLMRFDERSGGYRRVNEKLLPGLLHSRNGGTYRYVDPEAMVGEIVTYELVELEATGNELTYGPYTVPVEINAEAAGVEVAPALDEPLENFQRVQRALSAIQEARMALKARAREEARAAKLARKGRRAKITVREAGAFYLDAARIADVLGHSRDEVTRLIDAGRLVLRNRGERVATFAAAGNAGLYFYGEGIDSQYTLDNVYWLAKGDGLTMTSRDGQLPPAATGNTFSHTSRAEGNGYGLTHLFDDPDDDYWMWDFRFEDMIFPMNEGSYTVPSLGVAARDDAVARLTVRLHGGTETELDTDHRATITFNGTELGTVEFDGLSPASAEFEVPTTLLNDGDNHIEVTGQSTGIDEQPSVFYINDFALTYPRRYRAEEGRLAFSSAAHRIVSVDGFDGDDVHVWDLRNRQRPKRVVNAAIEELVDGYRVSFAAPKAATSHITFSASAASSPESVIADLPSDLKRRYHGVDYLVITASDLMDAAEGLAQTRSARGLRTKVVDIEDIYDEFNHGIKDADAIWSFLHHAHTRWLSGPRYVALAGEGSFDYKDHLGFGDSIIPTLLTPTPQGLFPSDNLYADVVGNDWLPEMAIGRLPVIDAAELVALTAKIAAYEQSEGDWQQRVVMAADFPDLGGEFTVDSNSVAELVPGSHELERIHLDELLAEDARSRMLDAFASGRAFVNFFGHSGHMSIGNTNLINVLDVPGLANAERLPVVTAFTCLAGQFGFPGQESIAETLVIASNGGAAAVWSPSGLSLNNRAKLLSEGFYTGTFEQGELVIGEVILRAQAHYARDGIDKYLLDVYNLVGDPATIMK